MKSKVGLDFAEVKRARIAAKEIAIQVQHFVDGYSTVAVERTLCRLLGIDGVDANGVPMPNVVVEHLEHNGKLDNGVIYHIGNAVKETGLSPQVIAEQIVSGELDLDTLPVWSKEEILEGLKPYVDAAINRIRERRARREEFLKTLGEGSKPYLYVIVATGNIYEDVIQAQAAARQGADIIAVIRTTGQSLLDYVPYGATTEGFGGTFATISGFA